MTEKGNEVTMEDVIKKGNDDSEFRKELIDCPKEAIEKHFPQLKGRIPEKVNFFVSLDNEFDFNIALRPSDYPVECW